MMITIQGFLLNTGKRFKAKFYQECGTPGPCLVRFLGPGQKAHEPKPHELSQKHMSQEFRIS